MKRKIEDKLKAWRDQKEGRRPLLLCGARQVGKTYILNDFGEKYFKNTVYINFETNPSIASVFDDDISPDRVIRMLEAVVGEEISPRKTLLILDEIQSCERALTSLKYFCEQAGEYHIAAAGSLLGVALNREKFSFPVGKVQNLNLYPLDFEEFLWANEESALAAAIRDAAGSLNPLSEILHKKALELYHNYLIVGGMPAAVNEYLKTGKLILVPGVQNEILEHYLADMAKYSSPDDTVKIRACFDSIPAQLAKDNRKFQYRVVKKGGSSTYFGTSINWLVQAGIALKCRKVQHGYDPLSVYEDLSSFKLYMSDVGLLTAKSGISPQTILLGGPNTFMGAVTENYVATQLASCGIKVYYWAPSDSQAELDFVIQPGQIISNRTFAEISDELGDYPAGEASGGGIFAIECKRGAGSRSRSLGMFINKYSPTRAIRFSEENFYRTNSVDALPLYAVFCMLGDSVST